MPEHLTTDPACVNHLAPITFTEIQRYNRMRGYSCPVCMPALFDEL